jgi:hypothetical protein
MFRDQDTADTLIPKPRIRARRRKSFGIKRQGRETCQVQTALGLT